MGLGEQSRMAIAGSLWRMSSTVLTKTRRSGPPLRPVPGKLNIVVALSEGVDGLDEQVEVVVAAGDMVPPPKFTTSGRAEIRRTLLEACQDPDRTSAFCSHRA